MGIRNLYACIYKCNILKKWESNMHMNQHSANDCYSSSEGNQWQHSFIWITKKTLCQHEAIVLIYCVILYINHKTILFSWILRKLFWFLVYHKNNKQEMVPQIIFNVSANALCIHILNQSLNLPTLLKILISIINNLMSFLLMISSYQDT